LALEGFPNQISNDDHAEYACENLSFCRKIASFIAYTPFILINGPCHY